MPCGIHVAHRGQFLRRLRGAGDFSCPAAAAHYNSRNLLPEPDNDKPGFFGNVARGAFVFAATYFSAALFLALGGHDALACVFLVASRYTGALHRAACASAGFFRAVFRGHANNTSPASAPAAASAPAPAWEPIFCGDGWVIF
jgi:hypothetical protein